MEFLLHFNFNNYFYQQLLSFKNQDHYLNIK